MRTCIATGTSFSHFFFCSFSPSEHGQEVGQQIAYCSSALSHRQNNKPADRPYSTTSTRRKRKHREPGRHDRGKVERLASCFVLFATKFDCRNREGCKSKPVQWWVAHALACFTPPPLRSSPAQRGARAFSRGEEGKTAGGTRQLQTPIVTIEGEDKPTRTLTGATGGGGRCLCSRAAQVLASLIRGAPQSATPDLLSYAPHP